LSTHCFSFSNVLCPVFSWNPPVLLQSIFFRFAFGSFVQGFSSGFEICDVLWGEVQSLASSPTWGTRSPYLWPTETEWPSYTPRHWEAWDLGSVTSLTHNNCEPLRGTATVRLLY
jgi:hypothetical protein